MRDRARTRPVRLWPAVLLGLAAVAVVLVAPRSRGQGPSRCRVVPAKVAAPAEIPLGDTVRVTLTMTAECPAEPSPVDVVLLVDRSSSMTANDKLANAKAGAGAFLKAMDLTLSRIGLVAFNETPELVSALSSDRPAMERAIDNLQASGQTNISAAIEVARRELVRDPRDARAAMIVLTDGYNTVSGAEPVADAAGRAKADGITVVTVCAGGQCDDGLEPAASAPELYFSVVDTTQLADLYRELAKALQLNGIASMQVRDQIPANMRYIVGSAIPEPAEVGADFLRWEIVGDFPATGLSYELQPLEPGLHPTNVVATGEFVDRQGRTGDTVFPLPQVRVTVDPCAPIPLEVFFLIDDSNCLAGAWLNGMPCLQAVKLGIGEALAILDLGRDTAAVIGFGDQAVTFQTLTADRDAILRAVDQISFRDNAARLDLAFVEVAREIASARHRTGTRAATIVVTDGPMTPALDLALARGEALRRQGVKHYTIAVGDSLLAQQTVLRSLAEPGGFRALAYNGDVITAYKELGAAVAGLSLGCPPTPTPGAVATATPRSTGTPPRDFQSFLPSAQRN